MSRAFRAATRGSRLALWQANHVVDRMGVPVELDIVRTSGDKTQAANIPIESMRGTGVFSQDVQIAVLERRVDFAVHSAKDLSSREPDGLTIACILERGDPRDCLVGCSLESLPVGGRVATGSVRRRAQLSHLRPDLKFDNLRGNVDTRLEKAKDYDAIIMAVAGIQRIDRTDVELHILEPSVMLPMVAQGALAVECRADDEELIALLQGIEHAESRRAVDAERAFLAELGGGCDLPVGAYATIENDTVHLDALVASLDGEVVLRRQASGTDAVALGQSLARRLLDEDGGAQLFTPQP